jgi:hypothetical protein
MPSATDRASAIPWYEYLIVSLLNRELYTVQAWRLTADNQFAEVAVEQVQTVHQPNNTNKHMNV